MSMVDRPPRNATGPIDVRPTSPSQLAIVGAVVWLFGALLHPLAFLVPIGLLLLAVAAVGYLIRPRGRTMYWRGRRIDLPGDATPASRLYRAIFRG
jgi:hypothetical protein